MSLAQQIEEKKDLAIQAAMIEIVKRRPINTRPIVWKARINGKRVVVKDYRSNGFFFRNTIGRFLIWREARTYMRLSGMKGIPKFYGVIDGLAIVLEDIPGKNLGKFKKGNVLPKSFFDSLEELVKKIHEMGVVHCDLKKANNIIVGEDGKPYIIDWGASIHKEEFDLPILRRIYERFLLDDNLAIIKHKLRFAPSIVTEEEKRRYEHLTPFERFIRKVRDKVLPVFQRLM